MHGTLPMDKRHQSFQSLSQCGDRKICLQYQIRYLNRGAATQQYFWTVALLKSCSSVRFSATASIQCTICAVLTAQLPHGIKLL